MQGNYVSPVPTRTRILLLQPRRDGVQIRLCLLQSHVWSESRDYAKKPCVTYRKQINGGIGIPIRHNPMWIEPDLVLIILSRVLEPGRHYADGRDWLTAERKCLADHVWITAKPLLPEIVADDCYARCACASIFRLKDAPAFCRNAKQ